MMRRKIYEKLCAILEDIFDLDEGLISPETSFIDTLAADLPDMLELSMIIEEEFDISFEDHDLSQIDTVEDMLDYICDKSEE